MTRPNIKFVTKTSTQIIQVQDIPHTLNGKPVEVPVRKVRASLCLDCADDEHHCFRL